MHITQKFSTIVACAAFIYTADAWKPAAGKLIDVSDPRTDVLNTYRRAISIIEVQTYLTERQTSPGNVEDHLIIEFQEAVSGQEIAKASEYLKDYPDDQVAMTLLTFQIKMTAGIWPPWKRLALALFDRCPDIVNRILPSLSREEQTKFLDDVEMALSMATGRHALFPYPLPSERKAQIRAAITRLRQEIRP